MKFAVIFFLRAAATIGIKEATRAQKPQQKTQEVRDDCGFVATNNLSKNRQSCDLLFVIKYWLEQLYMSKHFINF